MSSKQSWPSVTPSENRRWARFPLTPRVASLSGSSRGPCGHAPVARASHGRYSRVEVDEAPGRLVFKVYERWVCAHINTDGHPSSRPASGKLRMADRHVTRVRERAAGRQRRHPRSAVPPARDRLHGRCSTAPRRSRADHAKLTVALGMADRRSNYMPFGRDHERAG